jgi:hypothetical protein
MSEQALLNSAYAAIVLWCVLAYLLSRNWEK